jgi:hypothetical protein
VLCASGCGGDAASSTGEPRTPLALDHVEVAPQVERSLRSIPDFACLVIPSTEHPPLVAVFTSATARSQARRQLQRFGGERVALARIDQRTWSRTKRKAVLASLRASAPGEVDVNEGETLDRRSCPPIEIDAPPQGDTPVETERWLRRTTSRYPDRHVKIRRARASTN